MPLSDDDILVALNFADTGSTFGVCDPSQWVQVALGGAEDEDWAMVARHEGAHVALNMMTTFGLFLQVLAKVATSATSLVDISTLANYVGACRTTHEVFATTTGVWTACSDDSTALASYPAYRHYLRAGETLIGDLEAGSLVALLAVQAAACAAMQVPVGIHIDALKSHGLDTKRPPITEPPDYRFAVLLRETPHLDIGALDVPEEWVNARTSSLDNVPAAMNDLQQDVLVTFYDRFREVLIENGLPCLAFAEMDPGVVAWAADIGLGSHDALSNVGADPYWSVIVSDRERVGLQPPHPLLCMHLADLPSDDGAIDWDSLVVGSAGFRNVVVVVRPLEVILQQYKVDEYTRRLLAAGATGGVITAARVQSSGEDVVTLFGLLSSQRQVLRLSQLDLDVGVLSSVSLACMGISEWREYWADVLIQYTHTMFLVDAPRRQWIEYLESVGMSVSETALYVERTGGPSLYGHVVVPHFDDGQQDVAYLLVGSAFMQSAFHTAIMSSNEISVEVSEGFPGGDKDRALVRRLVREEPWFDARSNLALRGGGGPGAN